MADSQSKRDLYLLDSMVNRPIFHDSNMTTGTIRRARRQMLRKKAKGEGLSTHCGNKAEYLAFVKNQGLWDNS